MSTTPHIDSRTSPQFTGVRPGQHARNLLSGETTTFRVTSTESAGERVEFEVEFRPFGAPGGLPHRHFPAERFDISEGALWVWIAGRRPWVARSGDVISIPPRRWHFVLALRRSRAHVSVRPGMCFDELPGRRLAAATFDRRPFAAWCLCCANTGASKLPAKVTLSCVGGRPIGQLRFVPPWR